MRRTIVRKGMEIVVSAREERIVIIAFIGFTALFFNLFFLAAIYKKLSKITRTHLYLTNVCVANLGTLCVISFHFASVDARKWLFSTDACYFSAIATEAWLHANMFTHVLLTVHKFTTIVRPFAHVDNRRRAMLKIVFGWLLALFLVVLELFDRNVIFAIVNAQCVLVFPDATQPFVYVSRLLAYVVPYVFICACYVRMFYALRRHARRLYISTGQKNLARTGKLLFIFFSFFMCWTLYVLCRLVQILQITIPSGFIEVAYTLVYSSCATTPLVFLFNHVRIRKICSALCRHTDHRSDNGVFVISRFSARKQSFIPSAGIRKKTLSNFFINEDEYSCRSGVVEEKNTSSIEFACITQYKHLEEERN